MIGAGMRFTRYVVVPPGTSWNECGNRVPDADKGESYWFWCLGCLTHHRYVTKYAKGEVEMHAKEGRNSPLWTFNGDMEKPTFAPSLLYMGWKDQNGKDTGRCHLFLRDGVIEYLSDCYHKLAGQKVPLPKMPGE